MKVVVLAGGYSPERDVSLSSGSLIANALIENGHEVLLLDLYLGMEPEQVRYLNRSSTERFSYTVPSEAPDLEKLKRESGNGNSLIGRHVPELCREADMVFLALHGSIGENGQIQALFDVYGIPYTGSSYIGCLLAMDKDLSKKLMRYHGIRTPDWTIVDIRNGEPEVCKYPCVVKPCSCGSSVGVSIVETQQELQTALEAARLYEDMVMIEEKISGREFSVGVLDGKALPPIEIIPKAGFYDYRNKYQSGMTEEICPAQVEDAVCQRMQEAALALHQALRIGYYSRTDFLCDEAGELYCLEVNTLPGMTPTSLLPQEAMAVGISYEELCERIVTHGFRFGNA